MLIGVVLLAAAAFVLSYSGMRAVAISAGVSPARAGLFPLIFDITLAIACLAVLRLRGAGWWRQAFAWFTIMILLAAVALVLALRADGTSLPPKPAAAAVAAIPWLLLLLGFGLALSMLRHVRGAGDASPPAADRATTAQAIGRAHPGRPAANDRAARWRTLAESSLDPATPDVRLIPPGGPAAEDPDTPDVRLIPAPPKPAGPDSEHPAARHPQTS